MFGRNRYVRISFDAEMGKILRDNAGALASIMVDGERDAKKRGAFNTAVLKALDALVTKSQSDGGANDAPLYNEAEG
jgi:hypothetical protein